MLAPMGMQQSSTTLEVKEPHDDQFRAHVSDTPGGASEWGPLPFGTIDSSVGLASFCEFWDSVIDVDGANWPPLTSISGPESATRIGRSFSTGRGDRLPLVSGAGDDKGGGEVVSACFSGGGGGDDTGGSGSGSRTGGFSAGFGTCFSARGVGGVEGRATFSFVSEETFIVERRNKPLRRSFVDSNGVW